MSKTFWDDLKSGRFASMVKESSRGQLLTNSQEVYNILKPLFVENDIEILYCIFLDSKNRIISIEKLFTGSIASTAIYPREIVKQALSFKSAAVMMCHNHPSGSADPSSEDYSITRKVIIALSSIDVPLHEHLIIGDGYFSMADQGVLKRFKQEYEKFITNRRIL